MDSSRPLFGRIVHSSRAANEHEYRAGLFTDAHTHDHSYLTIILSGVVRETFVRRTEDLTPGDVQLMIAGERHSNRYLVPTRCLHMEVDHILHEVPAVAPGPRRDPLTANYASIIRREASTPDDLAPVAIEGLLFALLTRFSRDSEAPPPWLHRVTDVLRSEYTSTPRLRDLASIAGVHRAHLCREFHRHMNRTIGSYVRELRVESACELLRTTKDTIANVALRCGFVDQSHFTNAFRRVMRMTPGQFRRIATQPANS